MPTIRLYLEDTISTFFFYSAIHLLDCTSSFSAFVSNIIATAILSVGKYQPSGLSITPLNPSWLKVVICPVHCFTFSSSSLKPSISFAESLTSSSVRLILFFIIQFYYWVTAILLHPPLNAYFLPQCLHILI